MSDLYSGAGCARAPDSKINLVTESKVMNPSQQEILARLARLEAMADGPGGDLHGAEDTLTREIGHIRRGLRSLPEVDVDENVWRRHLPRADVVTHWRWMRYPMATAASVVMVSAVLVFGLVSGVGTLLPDQGPASTAREYNLANPIPAQLTVLMNQSRELEQSLYGVSAWRTAMASAAPAAQGDADMHVSSLSRYLLYRLAELDSRLSATTATNERIGLWGERVNLLRALTADMALHNPEQFEYSRTM